MKIKILSLIILFEILNACGNPTLKVCRNEPYQVCKEKRDGSIFCVYKTKKVCYQQVNPKYAMCIYNKYYKNKNK